MRLAALFLMTGLTASSIGCGGQSDTAGRAPDTATAVVDTVEATGIVRSVTPSGSHIVIAHDEIPGYMDAMTMSFRLADSMLAAQVAAGDSVRFLLTLRGAERVVVAISGS